jgi:CelD/BcsL family acetyltransferase involved in cellulose biosynthesis
MRERTLRTPSGLAPVTVSVVRDLAALERERAAWAELAGRAIEANVFYEPDMLLPALRHLRPPPGWRVLLIRLQGRLIGVVPLQRYALGHWRTGLALELLRHRHSYLHLPLIDRSTPDLAIDAWLDWCARALGPTLTVGRRLTLDGPLGRLLRQRAEVRGFHVTESRPYARPALIPTDDADRLLGRALDGDRRRELRRQARRLDGEGRAEFRWVRPGEPAETWIDGFLTLEAQGWKGQNRSAIASRPGQRPFFHAAITSLHASGRAMLGGLTLNGRWIAMNCSLRGAAADAGAFAFKTAYDEALSRLAPGLLLEAEFIRRLCATPDRLPWLDSCCGPDNAAIARLWPERRLIGDLTLAAPGPRGSAALWALERAQAWRLRQADAGRRPAKAAD